jgi:hypothetical protein
VECGSPAPAFAPNPSATQTLSGSPAAASSRARQENHYVARRLTTVSNTRHYECESRRSRRDWSTKSKAMNAIWRAIAETQMEGAVCQVL